MSDPVPPTVPDLLRKTFQAKIIAHWERGKGITLGARPHWLDWPCVRLVDMARESWIAKSRSAK